MSRKEGTSLGYGDFRVPLPWLAPELFAVSHQDPPRLMCNKMTDMWAFGMLAYELLSWNAPYFNKAEDKRVLSITQGELPEKPEGTGNPQIFYSLWDFCNHCWSGATGRPTAAQAVKILDAIAMPPGPSVTDLSGSMFTREASLGRQPVNMPVVSNDAAAQRVARADSNQHRDVLSSNTNDDNLKRLLARLSAFDLAEYIVQKQPHASKLGGFADVFTAYSTKHRTKVALKQVRVHLKNDFSFAKKLANEIRIWSDLDNNYVLPFLGFFIEGEEMLPTLVSEWMERGTVDGYMQRFPRGGEETWNMASRISSGLVYLHFKGVIHADLKCANILVTEKGRPLLADFGISVAMLHSYTTTYNARGTCSYMAFELLAGPEDEAPKHTKMTDVWAFGMVVYELLSGLVPYGDKKSNYSVSRAIVAYQLPEIPDLDESYANYGSVLRRMCRSCWEKDPQKRPTAEEIEDILTSGSRFFRSLQVLQDSSWDDLKDALPRDGNH